MLTQEELTLYINGCRRNERASQKKLYISFYGFAMSLCFKYVCSKEDSVKIVNDGFFKVFKELVRSEAVSENTTASFINWLERIMINTAIDHCRKNNEPELNDKLTGSFDVFETTNETSIHTLTYNEIIKVVKTLPLS